MAINEEFRNLEERVKKLEEMVFVNKSPLKRSGKKSIMNHLEDLKTENFFGNPRFVIEIVKKLAEK
jgi:hypothetical protein